MARTSIARKIKFAHVAKDGKTSVYNPTTKKWEYQLDPTAQQLADSSDRLLNIDNNATTAKNIAESKVDMDDVLGLFPVDDGERVITSVNFTDDSAGNRVIYLCTAPASHPEQGMCEYLGYATKSEFEALEKRVANIEKLLGKT